MMKQALKGREEGYEWIIHSEKKCVGEKKTEKGEAKAFAGKRR